MSKPYDSEWTIEVLKDLSAFFEANGMAASKCKTSSLIEVVKAESSKDVEIAGPWKNPKLA